MIKKETNNSIEKKPRMPPNMMQATAFYARSLGLSVSKKREPVIKISPNVELLLSNSGDFLTNEVQIELKTNNTVMPSRILFFRNKPNMKKFLRQVARSERTLQAVVDICDNTEYDGGL